MSDAFQQLEIDWEAITREVLNMAEAHFGFIGVLDPYILAEVIEFTRQGLRHNYRGSKPNVAKIAGMFSFWFRKFKPISFAKESQNRYLAINEFVALQVGLGVCQRYKDDLSNPDFSVRDVSRRLRKDWVHSLRIHSHSPNSTIMSFELLAANVSGKTGV